MVKRRELLLVIQFPNIDEVSVFSHVKSEVGSPLDQRLVEPELEKVGMRLEYQVAILDFYFNVRSPQSCPFRYKDCYGDCGVVLRKLN